MTGMHLLWIEIWNGTRFGNMCVKDTQGYKEIIQKI